MVSAATAVDCDMHLFEPAGMWQRYCDPGERHLALRTEADELGYVWLVAGSAPAFFAHNIDFLLRR